MIREQESRSLLVAISLALSSISFTARAETNLPPVPPETTTGDNRTVCSTAISSLNLNYSDPRLWAYVSGDVKNLVIAFSRLDGDPELADLCHELLELEMLRESASQKLVSLGKSNIGIQIGRNYHHSGKDAAMQLRKCLSQASAILGFEELKFPDVPAYVDIYANPDRLEQTKAQWDQFFNAAAQLYFKLFPLGPMDQLTSIRSDPLEAVIKDSQLLADRARTLDQRDNYRGIASELGEVWLDFFSVVSATAPERELERTQLATRFMRGDPLTDWPSSMSEYCECTFMDWRTDGSSLAALHERIASEINVNVQMLLDRRANFTELQSCLALTENQRRPSGGERELLDHIVLCLADAKTLGEPAAHMIAEPTSLREAIVALKLLVLSHSARTVEIRCLSSRLNDEAKAP